MMRMPLIARFRAVPVAIGGTVALSAAVALAGWARNGVELPILVLFICFFDAIVDVAQNLIGITVQDASRCPSCPR